MTLREKLIKDLDINVLIIAITLFSSAFMILYYYDKQERNNFYKLEKRIDAVEASCRGEK